MIIYNNSASTVAFLAASGNGDALTNALLAQPVKSSVASYTSAAGTGMTLISLIKEIDVLLLGQGYNTATQTAINSYVIKAAKKLNPGTNINITV